MDNIIENENIKVGFINIIGRSNVGKSTLLNAIIGEKIAITSNKPQTTRNKIRGIYNDEESQIIFLDTPGLQIPKNKLGRYMRKESTSSISGSDIVMYVVDDQERIGKIDNEIIENLKRVDKVKILVLNKIDKLKEEDILKRIKLYADLKIFDEIVPVSATKKRNINELLRTIKKYLVYSHKFFNSDSTTDQSTSFMISEIIREKVLNYLDEEVPHGVFVEIEKIKDKKNIIEISAVIYCEKQSHKKIIIGKDGRKLKGIGKAARLELEEIFGCKVYLENFVKVKENWRENKNYIKEFGFKED